MKTLSAKYFKCHFELRSPGGCGLAALNSVLMMMEKRGIIYSYSPEKGISPAWILRELRRVGLKATPKTISIRNLKGPAILWYPGQDGGHYVAVCMVRNGKALICDSEKSRLYWLPFPYLRKKWYRFTRGRWCGWVIEVRKE